MTLFLCPSKAELERDSIMENKNKVSERPSFGNGIFSSVMDESFNTFQEYLGFSPAQAERVSRALGADAGKLGFKLDLKAGKLVGKHDGKISLRAFSDSVKTTITPAITLFKLTELLKEAKKYGLKNSRDIDIDPALLAWVNNEPTSAGLSGAQRAVSEASVSATV